MLGCVGGRCIAAGSYLQPQPQDVWLAAGRAARAFQGRTVHLHGDAGGPVQQFSTLLQHAGRAQPLVPVRLGPSQSCCLQPA